MPFFIIHHCNAFCQLALVDIAPAEKLYGLWIYVNVVLRSMVRAGHAEAKPNPGSLSLQTDSFPPQSRRCGLPGAGQPTLLPGIEKLLLPCTCLTLPAFLSASRSRIRADAVHGSGGPDEHLMSSRKFSSSSSSSSPLSPPALVGDWSCFLTWSEILLSILMYSVCCT